MKAETSVQQGSSNVDVNLGDASVIIQLVLFWLPFQLVVSGNRLNNSYDTLALYEMHTETFLVNVSPRLA